MHNNLVFKVIIIILFITLPVMGFIFGLQYQSISKPLKLISDNFSEMDIWIDTGGNAKLFTKQDKKTFSGDLYYSYTFYDSYIKNSNTKIIKVLEIGDRLPGINFGRVEWSPDGKKFLINMSMGDSYAVYLCFTDGSPSKKLNLVRSFRTEEYTHGWLDNEKIIGVQKTYKETIQEPIDRVDTPKNYIKKYWIAPVLDLDKKTFLNI